ncbi:MAG: hypothetical protein JHD16_17085 [Solirubrobacteraceae bacterium]|nr:hypothetical protein [Solirubrobacteraceae bacterium]
MSLFDELSGALSSIAGVLSALGPRPDGDPAGMRALARAIEAEAETVGTIASRAGGLPGEMVFVGPAASRFAGHASQVRGVVSSAAGQLERVAADVRRQAAQVERAQQEYDRARKGLEDKIQDLTAQLRNASR